MTLEIHGLARRYGDATVFGNVSLTVAAGEFVAIVGESGVGKSTLLNCMAGLDHWDAGRVLHDDTDLGTLDAEARAVWRRKNVGFVFQAFHVLPHLDVAQNVGLPLMLLGQHKGARQAESRERVQQMLTLVGLGDYGARLPQQLSGGQLQRVAIARALAMDPVAMLFDEPTSALDPEMVSEVLDVISTLAQDGMTMMIVTHEMGFARKVANRIVFMDKGRIVEDAPQERFFAAPASNRARQFLARILH